MENKIVNICIVHFNTPILTECLVKSINKFTPNSKIYIFDNSDKQPFTYRQDNIVYFDNTKGQIINFDKWLRQFPNRNKSNAKINQWGSAKHAYTIQKCIDLIPDGFILLDSDILLKRDISELVCEDCAYVAEVEQQGTSDIYRVIPFVCYINSKFLKEHKITYFNPSYMHGLYVTGAGDMYDTGSWFYKSAKNFKSKTIICNDYAVHFKGASWNTVHENRYGKNISASDWLNIHKKLYMNDEDCKNNKVIYTCITNKYDGLYEVQSYFPGYDFVCYTDNIHLKSRTWEIRYIPEYIKNLTPVKQQRYIKTHPHEFFKEYEISIWVDGNVDVLQDPTPLINDNYIEIPRHPARNCIYKEAKECISQRKDSAAVINKQIAKYKKEGFPKDFGLPQSGIIIRRHNDERCIKLMEDWWKEIETGSHRDQLSFSYVLWKNKDINVFYLDKSIFSSKYFYWNKKHGMLSPLNRKTSVVKTKTVRNVVSSKPQIERPNKVHVESTWNPIEQHPKRTVTKAPAIPKTTKKKNDRIVIIKRLFY
jgi:hypothetical protein